MPQRFRIYDQPDRLRISVPFLSLPLRIILLAGVFGLLGLLFIIRGPVPGLLVLTVVTGYFALVIGLNSNILTVERGRLRSRYGPIPIPGPRRTLDSSDILQVQSTLVRAAAGRGGRYERYALLACTRYGRKPVVLLEGFLREEDAAVAADILIRRLNLIRPPDLGPIDFRRA